MAQYASERARLHLIPNAADTAGPSMHPDQSPISQASALSSSPKSGSRRSLSTDATAVELDLEDGELEGGKLSVLLGFGAIGSKRARGTDIGENEGGGASFVYDADLVRSAVFPPPVVLAPTVTPPGRKKRKLETGASEIAEISSRTVLLYNDTTM